MWTASQLRISQMYLIYLRQCSKSHKAFEMPILVWKAPVEK